MTADPASRLLEHSLADDRAADALREHATDERSGADALIRLPAALADLDAAQAEVAVLRAANGVLGEELQAAQAQISDLQATATGQAAVIAELQATIAAQAGVIVSCNQRIIDQAAEIERLLARIAELEQGLIPLMPAHPAGSVHDGFGANTHWSYLATGSVYKDTDRAVDKLLELGAGSVRQLLPTTPHGRAAVRKALTRLRDAGGLWLCQVFGAERFADLDAAKAHVRGHLDWIEAEGFDPMVRTVAGPNEPNGEPAVEDWVQQARWCQQALWEETRARPAFDDALVLTCVLNMKGGPNAVAPDVEALGDLSAWCDVIDARSYPGAHDPEYQLQEMLDVLQPIAPGKPVGCASEGGYSTLVDAGYEGGAELCHENAAGLYAPKQLLTLWQAGLDFYAYELLGNTFPYKEIREAGFGLYDTPTLDAATWRRKPAFEALRRLLGLVRDVDYEPQPLAVKIEGGGDDLRTVLLHHSDGHWLLCLWRAVDVYEWDTDTRTGRTLPVEPYPVTVTFQNTHAVTVFEPSVQDAPTDTIPTVAQFSPLVGAGMLVLQIR